MKRTWLIVIAIAASLAASNGCGAAVDLSKGLEVTDILTGYYDAGLKNGWNYLKPSISFRLRNKADQKIGPVQITVAYWKENEDGEWDSIVLQGIHAAGLGAGATTESLLARAPNVGYNLQGARPSLFDHGGFKDVTVKLFASQAGHIVPLGVFKIDHTIIPHLQ